MDNIQEITRARSKNYFVENCIEDAIEKAASMVGDQEAMNMAKRAGWIDPITGKKRTKMDIK